MSIALDIALLLRDSIDNFNLSLSTIGVLYTLAFRIGSNSSTWIAQETLADELNMTDRMVKKHCRYLKKSKLVLIKKNPQDKRRNMYSFNPKIENYHSKRDKEKDAVLRALGSEPRPEYRNYSSPNSKNRGTIVHLNTGNIVPLFSEDDPKKTTVESQENGEAISPKVKEQRNNKSKGTIFCSSDEERENLFSEFWSVYPRKDNKPPARTAWVKALQHETAENIIADVKMRSANHVQWKNPQFIPLPSTYLNNQQWQNEMILDSGAKNANGKNFKNVRDFAESIYGIGEEAFHTS